MNAKILRKIGVVLLCLMLLLVGAFALGRLASSKNEQREEAQPTGQDAQLQIEDAAPETSSDVAIQPPQLSVEDQPTNLTMLLEQNGITYENLVQRGCSQLVCVVADGASATIYFFACNDDTWQEYTHLSCNGYVGRSGVATDKKEGDGSTPCGLYDIGDAFYIDDAPQTELNTFQITTNTYWVDDPDSKYYNQRVEGLENKDWDSAEHMIEYAAYRYGFVVEYNPAAEYNAGSAIFFHVGNNPTIGCIATQTEMVKAYLAELDAARKPCILILRESSLPHETQ